MSNTNALRYSASNPLKVMVVEDSTLLRRLFTDMLQLDGSIKVVQTAANGAEAVEKCSAAGALDVIVLDVEMPIMDGLTALPLLLKACPDTSILIVSSLSRSSANAAAQALTLGAADYLQKPKSSATLRDIDAFNDAMVEKIKELGNAGRVIHPSPEQQQLNAAAMAEPVSVVPAVPVALAGELRFSAPPSALAIGSSTGGPQALISLFKDFRPEELCDIPIFITQHLPPAFAAFLAENIQRSIGRSCVEAKDGEVATAGNIYFAPGDYHMEIHKNALRKPVIRLNQNAPENFCRPAVDPMLRSLAEVYGNRLLVVILTGMGQDGKAGCEEVVKAGGVVLAQNKESSVVWGMPGAVANAGLCHKILPLDKIASYIRQEFLERRAKS